MDRYNFGVAAAKLRVERLARRANLNGGWPKERLSSKSILYGGEKSTLEFATGQSRGKDREVRSGAKFVARLSTG